MHSQEKIHLLKSVTTSSYMTGQTSTLWLLITAKNTHKIHVIMVFTSFSDLQCCQQPSLYEIQAFRNITVILEVVLGVSKKPLEEQHSTVTHKTIFWPTATTMDLASVLNTRWTQTNPTKSSSLLVMVLLIHVYFQPYIFALLKHMVTQ
jgi:hypothetical protein